MNATNATPEVTETAGTAVPYKRARIADHWDAIVIGSGMGGLAAAAMLARHGGKRVLVLERHYAAGGFTHVFHRPGFDWDVGLHYIGQVNDPRSSVRRAFDHVTGGGVQWTPMPEVYDRIRIGGRMVDFAAGEENFRASLLAHFPSEARAVDRYLCAVRAAMRWSTLYQAEKVVPPRVASLLGGLLRAPYLRWAGRTTLDVLSSITSNRELIGVLTAQWGDYGLPPAESSFAIHATIANHYMNGAAYPVGGSASISEAILPTLGQAGGMVVVSAEVSEILVEQNKATGVRMADGREIRADFVLSDAGALNTFFRLLPADLPATAALRASLRGFGPSMAHLNLYLGLDRSDAELGLDGTNLWIYPGYDHDENVRRFTQNPSGPFPAVYISFPSAKNPEFARHYPGHSTIEAIAPIAWQTFSRWAETRWQHRGADYDALKQELTAQLVDEVLRQVPAAAGHIAHAELSTPLSTRHFMNYQRGEIYGIPSTPARFRLRSLGVRTPVGGLFLTGQDAAAMGITGAMFSGILSASAALGKNLMSVVLKPARS